MTVVYFAGVGGNQEGREVGTVAAVEGHSLGVLGAVGLAADPEGGHVVALGPLEEGGPAEDHGEGEDPVAAHEVEGVHWVDHVVVDPQEGAGHSFEGEVSRGVDPVVDRDVVDRDEVAPGERGVAREEVLAEEAGPEGEGEGAPAVVQSPAEDRGVDAA